MSLSSFLESTVNRDRVVQVISYLPLIGVGATDAFGLPKATESLLNANQLADLYRAITRLSGMIDLTDRAVLGPLVEEAPRAVGRLAWLDWALSFAFFPWEHMWLLSHAGVLDPSNADRFGWWSNYFWFWGLASNTVLAAVRGAALLTRLRGAPPRTLRNEDQKSEPADPASEMRVLAIRIVKSLCFLVVSWSLFPKNTKLSKPSNTVLRSGIRQLLANGACRFVECTTPSPPNLSPMAKGVVGLLGSLCELTCPECA